MSLGVDTTCGYRVELIILDRLYGRYHSVLQGDGVAKIVPNRALGSWHDPCRTRVQDASTNFEYDPCSLIILKIASRT